MKTITALEVKQGDKIRIRHNNESYEMYVSNAIFRSDEGTVTLWGSWVLFGVPVSQYVILVSENWD